MNYPEDNFIFTGTDPEDEMTYPRDEDLTLEELQAKEDDFSNSKQEDYGY
jgi:hypothetical protein